MSVFSKLSPEQKEQAKNCKSEAELKEFLEGCGALTVDQLDAVAGGYLGDRETRAAPILSGATKFALAALYFVRRWEIPAAI